MSAMKIALMVSMLLLSVELAAYGQAVEGTAETATETPSETPAPSEQPAANAGADSAEPADSAAAEPNENPADPSRGMSVEDFLQRLSSVRNVLRRRDPFEDTEPEFVKKFRASEEALRRQKEAERLRQLELSKNQQSTEPVVEINPEDLPPLERFPSEEYEIVAVLMGGNSPKALVRVPKDGGTRIVQTKMALGDRGGVISEITPDGLVVDEKIRNNFGTFDIERITIPVGSAGK